MKFNHKIKINLEEFITLGKFDCIEIGQTKEWILNNFPDPDDIMAGKSIDKSPIWRYGNIEFHFREDKLSMIFCDYIEEMYGGDSLDLDIFFLHELNSLTFSSILNKLTFLKVNYSIKHELSINQVILTITESNIYMAFERMNHQVNDPNIFILFALCKK